jgi:thiol-disulfide isomerase/thioredoxin
LKFILFVSPAQFDEEVLRSWAAVARAFAKQAIFAYLQHPVADVVDYFGIAFPHDTPVIAAHEPTTDGKYKSAQLTALGAETMLEFVASVLTGTAERVVRSEVPPPPGKAGTSQSSVTAAVGSTVREVVAEPGRDVLLLMYTPWCAQCKQLLPAFELLGRAVQGEPRIQLARINALANDLPAAWGVKTYPTLLLFRASDKEAAGEKGPVKPHPYWDAGYSLHELAGFVQREGSFDAKTLRVASMEQLNSLLAEEPALREKYEEDERHYLRNKGRMQYDSAALDYLAGEVVFDGKRWHVVLVAVLGLLCACLLAYVVVASFSAPHKATKRKGF